MNDTKQKNEEGTSENTPKPEPSKEGDNPNIREAEIDNDNVEEDKSTDNKSSNDK